MGCNEMSPSLVNGVDTLKQSIEDSNYAVICKICGSVDVLRFCIERQVASYEDGTGQYKWVWPRCHERFMEWK